MHTRTYELASAHTLAGDRFDAKPCTPEWRSDRERREAVYVGKRLARRKDREARSTGFNCGKMDRDREAGLNVGFN